MYILGAFLFLSTNSLAQDKGKKKWYKGNLHTHSYWSDGDEFPEMIMDWYKSNAYDFVALSEHNTIAKGLKWKAISNDEIYQQAFQNYRDKYGSTYTIDHKMRNDTLWVRLKTLKEYGPLFNEEGKFLILPSEEITDQFESKPLHMNATNIQKLITPQGGNSVAEVIQKNINAVKEQRERTKVPMILQINHPNFGDAIGLEDLVKLQSNKFIEIFNGHPYVNNSGKGGRLSALQLWDHANIAYLNNGQGLLYGVATDDSHHYHKFGEAWSNSGRGWIMVNASKLEANTLVEAMDKGDFYSSTGVSLSKLEMKGNELLVHVQKEKGVNYDIQFIGCHKNDQETRVLKSVKGEKGSFSITNDYLFVRVEVHSDKKPANPIAEQQYEKAWTQPFTSK